MEATLKSKGKRSRSDGKTSVVSPPPPPKITKLSRAKEAFIAIHLGAGDYVLSDQRKEVYKTLCKKACSEAMGILLKGGSADEAATLATIVLEDSEIVNAGRGASLTINKGVECDAGFMSGDGHFGGVAAVPGVQNPILVAKKLADLHRKEPMLPCGRTPPLYLSGAGAKAWAKCNGVPTCDDKSMISRRSEKSYVKYMDRLNKLELDLGSEVSDTVGAIVLDLKGNVAATVSSGGNWLKQDGRVGHAPVFGCGCWASSNDKLRPAVAVSSSGSGEMLAKTRLPFTIAKLAGQEESFGLAQTVTTVINREFLENEILECHKEVKNVGLIALHCDGNRFEFSWGHTSKAFIVAHLISSSEFVKVEFSELKKGAGKSIQVNGINFKL